ncbi:MAG: glycosyltransferase [Hyphomicrobiaceae bacterium]
MLLGSRARRRRSVTVVPAGRVADGQPGSSAVGLLERLRHVGTACATAPTSSWRDHELIEPDLEFLLGRRIDRATLARAARLAAAADGAAHQVLLAQRWVEPEDYAALLAERLGLPVFSAGRLSQGAVRPARVELWQGAQAVAITVAIGAATVTLLDASSAPPRVVAGHVAALAARGHAVMLATAGVVGDLAAMLERGPNLREAVFGLRRRHPALSAAYPVAIWQLVLLTSLIGLTLGGMIMAPAAAFLLVSVLVSLPFLCVVLLRSVALVELLGTGRKTPTADRLADNRLPSYTVLVPLFREVAVLGQIVDALGRLDYPASKLQILLILEEVDGMTRAAVAGMTLPGNFEVVIVPDAQPRTKPKALNYALARARGELVAVYDAEDLPAPDQLRLAVAAFSDGRRRLACVQARLNIYNTHRSWLTRHFMLEYSALFDGLLPALDRSRLPLPLGGTSNHFRADVLRAVGAWDPFNVTEDADLGFRLARAGWSVGMIESVTLEEAPVGFGDWLPQRTRWLKGWMQTYLVHLRNPRLLYRELGMRGVVGFVVVMGGQLLSTLAYPVFTALLVLGAIFDALLAVPRGPWGQALLVVALLNLVLGHVSAMLLAAVAAGRRAGRPPLALVLSMPVYWLLISLAGYRALFQLMRDPFLWEKTDHVGLATGRRTLLPSLAGAAASWSRPV